MKTIKRILVAIALTAMGAHSASAQEPTLQTLNEQVITLSKRLESATAQISTLKATVATLQDNVQHLRSNDSTLVVILMQWHYALEQWRGYHIIHHLRWDNGWDIVKYSRANSDPAYYAGLGLGLEHRSRSIDDSWNFSSYGTGSPPTKLNSSGAASPTKPDR